MRINRAMARQHHYAGTVCHNPKCRSRLTINIKNEKGVTSRVQCIRCGQSFRKANGAGELHESNVR